MNFEKHVRDIISESASEQKKISAIFKTFFRGTKTLH